jgi:nicotinamidase-related amidase
MRTDTALLIVDVQTGLVAGTNPVYQLATLLENITTLISQGKCVFPLSVLRGKAFLGSENQVTSRI